MRAAVRVGLAGWVMVVAFCAGGTRIAHAGEPTVAQAGERRAALTRLVREDCGSCHGRTLGGGLGPPLTQQALAQKPVTAIAATIFYGRAGTPMPPWSPFLSESEAAWIAALLQRGFVDAN